MSMNGIDISNHQAGLDLTVVPCDFVICKATEGTGFVDKYCDGWIQKALAMGKSVGTYHFATGGTSGAREAEYYYEHTKGYVGKGIFVLDWEGSAVKKGPGYAKAFLDRFKELTGIKPLIYMSNSVIHAYDWSAVAAADYGLWNAGYYAGYQTMGYNPDAPLIGGTGPWKMAALYQYTSSGRLSGWNGNLDLDVFYGDATAWAKYGNASVQTGGNGNASTPSTGHRQIAVDGSCGPATISRWQEIMGTTVDGVISGQVVPGNGYSRPALPTSCVTYGGTGSELIRAVQNVLKANGVYTGDIDGLLGSKTIDGLHRYLGVATESMLPWTSFGPGLVRALQTRLNTGRF